MTFPEAPRGILYDNRTLYYFEVYPDGTINQISNDRSSINSKTENSLYQAYFRAKQNVCTLCVGMADGKSYRVTDLEALADSIGIERPSDHTHDIRVTYSNLDEGKGAYALVDLDFLCGCKLSRLNVRIIAPQLRKQYGLELVIGGMNSWPERRKLVSVKRNSLHQVLSKGNK